MEEVCIFTVVYCCLLLLFLSFLRFSTDTCSCSNCKINYLTIQDCSKVQIKLLHEVCSLDLNEKIDFLIKASKLGIPLDTNIVLALPRLGTTKILRYTLL